MAGVGITGKIKPKDGGAFPVFQDIDGQGGLRCVTTIAERDTFSAAPLYCTPGMQCYVEDLQCVYELAHDLATWSLFEPSPKLALQSDWFVSNAGNDNADGKTLGTAITQQELERRLFPRCSSLLLKSDVTIHIAAGTYPVQFFSVGAGNTTLNTLTIVYESSSSAEMTLTGVVNSNGATKARGRLTVGSGAFVNRERVRLTSGASVGALAYSMGLVAANPLDTFISAFGPGSLAQFDVNLRAAVGDRCVVDTLLTTVNRLDVVAHARTRVVVRDARITRCVVNGSPTESVSSDSGGNVNLIGCNAVSAQGFWQNNAGGASIFSCRWEPTTKTSLQGGNWLNSGSCVQGWMGVIGSVSSYGLAIDGGALFVGAEFATTHPHHSTPGLFVANASPSGGGSIEVENGPGPAANIGAVTLYPGSEMIVGDLVFCEQWGNSTPYSLGYLLLPGSYIYQSQPVVGTVAANLAIPSVVNVDAGGELFAFSDNEIFVPNQNCGVLAIGTIGTSRSYTDAQFYLTGQSGNKAVAAFSAGNFFAGSGLYRVSGYVATTTADAGAVGAPTLNVVFTDDSGVARTVAVCAAPSVTALGGAGGEVIIEVSAATAQTANSIGWSVTGVVTPLAAQYSARLRVEKVSSGL